MIGGCGAEAHDATLSLKRLNTGEPLLEVLPHRTEA